MEATEGREKGRKEGRERDGGGYGGETFPCTRGVRREKGERRLYISVIWRNGGCE